MLSRYCIISWMRSLATVCGPGFPPAVYSPAPNACPQTGCLALPCAGIASLPSRILVTRPVGKLLPFFFAS